MIQLCPLVLKVTQQIALNIPLIFKGLVVIYTHDHATQTPTPHQTFQAESACSLL